MYKNNYYVRESYPGRSSWKFFLKVLFLSATVLIFGYLIFTGIHSDSGKIIISPLAQKAIDKTLAIIYPKKNSANLAKIVSEVLGNDEDSYGLAIDNLATGEKYHLNEDKAFDTASLYKLWIMAVAYRQIENHELKKTDILSNSIFSLNEKFGLASDSARLEDETITWPVQNALEQMIIISDNYSALLLSEKVRLFNVANFLSENGFNDSKIGEIGGIPITTAHDMGLFMEKLYKEELAGNESTQSMLGLLKKQRINTKLPLNLSKGVVIAHKTGELGKLSHDVGIVYSPKGDYIIVVLSKTKDTLSANKKISEISKKVYDYFTK